MNSRTKRVRRSPEEARSTLLAAARARLLEHGLDGLKIAAVAKDAGMSHATLIHHFGSSLGMRDALIESMAHELLGEFVAMLGDDAPSGARLESMVTKLFATLADDRHAQLFAWLTIEPPQRPVDADHLDRASRDLLAVLLERIRRRDGRPALDPDVARFGVVLAVTSAIGLGIGRPRLEQMGLLRDADDDARFAAWVGELLEAHRHWDARSERLSSSRSSTGKEQLKPEQR